MGEGIKSFFFLMEGLNVFFQSHVSMRSERYFKCDYALLFTNCFRYHSNNCRKCYFEVFLFLFHFLSPSQFVLTIIALVQTNMQ